jgi:hypothetical protein
MPANSLVSKQAKKLGFFEEAGVRKYKRPFP